MPRGPHKGEPENLRGELLQLIIHFERELKSGDLQSKVKALIPAFHSLRDLGSSLLPAELASAARDRILYYFRQYPLVVIHGDELMVVSGIQEWARRLRELRVQFGWSILNGTTAKQMVVEEELSLDSVDFRAMVGPHHYILVDDEQDLEAAHRWNVANEIRRKNLGVRDKLLEFLRKSVGKRVTGEELRYIAKNRTEWARRVRELRTEQGWPVATRNTGRPDLPVGTYVLESDRQSPEHDRRIPDAVRRDVLRRDGYRCQRCDWEHADWNRSDPRHLESHHIQFHVQGGPNAEENLVTLCTVCHDKLHSSSGQ